ncbi:MAG: endolytic transglycosylase MltG [Clostridiales bacterium]|jgi:UPF0755 protein|nr:endolytic transglycosylase MltG [Clostridiales bacterium]
MRYPSYIKNVRERRKRHYVRLLLIAALAVFAVAETVSIRNDIFGRDADRREVTVEIAEGASTREIAALLREHNIIRHPLVFRLTAKARGAADSFQLGEHTLRSGMAYSEIIAAISVPSVPSGAVTVTIPEGSELARTADRLYQAFAQKGAAFDRDVFLELCETERFDYPFVQEITRAENRLEGYLFPSTYTFSGGVTEREVIVRLLDQFSIEYTEELRERAAALGMTTDEVITLASIVEREGASAEEFKTVASVFRNRLDKKMKLESCATVQYVLGERKEVLSVADTKIKSPYNTYLSFGLPVGPIASPGKAAIEAALYPAQTEYLYFVLKDGTHVFSRTYKEHLQAMN